MSAEENHQRKRWRIAGHKVFDALWLSGRMSRTQAYRWLAEKMRLRAEECHFHKFSVAQCQQAIDFVLIETDLKDLTQNG